MQTVMTVCKQIKGSIAALITPMEPGGGIDREAWLRLLDWHADCGTNGVVVGGTTGESGCLTTGEFEQLTRYAVDRFGDHGTVIMGVGSPSTKKSLQLIQTAEQCGADAVLAVTPYYNRPPQGGLAEHYRTLAEASKLPVIVYNVPARTGVDLLPDTFATIKQHSNIAGLKEANSAPDRLPALLALGGRSVTILSGDDPTACTSLQQGAGGVISVAANVVPRAFAAMCRHALNGSSELAEQVDRKLQELYAFLGCCSNPIPAKWYLNRLGLIQNGIRQPLIWLPAELEQHAEQIYEQYQNLNSFNG